MSFPCSAIISLMLVFQSSTMRSDASDNSKPVVSDSGDSGSKTTKCHRDESLGDLPVNVYHCSAEKPRCCPGNKGERKCCDEILLEIVSSQASIWAPIVGIIVLGVTAYCVLFKDSKEASCRKCLYDCCCKRRTPQRQNKFAKKTTRKRKGGRKKKNKDGDQASYEMSPHESMRSSPLEGYIDVTYLGKENQPGDYRIAY